MTAREVVELFVKYFNSSDPAALADLYHEDAINHQITRQPVKGKKAIQKMFEREFAETDMHCIVEHIFEDGEWAILEWKDPIELRGCGFFQVVDNKIKFQRGYWDQLSFFRAHNLPIPS